MWRLALVFMSVIAMSNSRSQIAEFSMNIASRIILAMHRRLCSTSISFLHNIDSDLRNSLIITQLQKALAVQLFSNVVSEVYLSRRPLYVLPSSNDKIKYFLQKVSASINMSKIKWLMFTDNAISLEDYFNNIYIPIDCEFIVVHQIREVVFFKEVYRVSPQTTLSVNNVGSWNTRGGLRWSDDSIYIRRANLQGQIIKAAVQPDSTSIIIKEFAAGNKPKHITGYFGEVWNILQRELNFSTDFSLSPDNSWGSLENKTWNGMVGMVVRKEAEVAVTAFTMTEQRIQAINFLNPYWTDSLALFIRKPDDFDKTWNQYISPFSKSLWIAIGLALVFLSLGLYATYKLGRRYSILQEYSVEYNFSNSFLVIYAALCQQSQETTPTTCSSRIVYVTSYFTAIILLASYSATFISKLAVRQPELPFTTFRGLLQDGTYRLAVIDKSAELDYFEKANDELMQLLNIRIIAREKHDLPKDHQEGLNRLCTRHKYAFLGPTSIVQSLAANLSCSIVPIPSAYIPATSAMIISKNSSYRRYLQYNTQKMQRNGVLERLLKSSTPYIPPVDITLNVESVTLQTIFPILIVLAVGLFSSVIFLFSEIIKQKLKHYRKEIRRKHSYSIDIRHNKISIYDLLQLSRSSSHK